MEIQITGGYKKYKRKAAGRSAKQFLESMKLRAYADVVSQVKKRLGKVPEKPVDLPVGEWSEQALRVLGERYLVKNEAGDVVETPEDMCWRVSWEIASAEVLWGASRAKVEEVAREFYSLLVNRKFLPNSPTLMNAGTGNNLQFSACFVLPVEDSMEGIFDALKNQAMIHKSGGGTGFSFTRLRPRGSMVKTSTGTASGPVSFMRIFDAATNEVKQGGKRRGANMGILRVDHPDIQEFIHCKDEGGISNFNISVAITDKFMEALDSGGDYDLIDPRNGKKAGSLSAAEVFNEIAESAWRTGDPGLVFIDQINKSSANPVPGLGPIEATNPCGEQPLYPFDSCNLGSIFLTYFVRDMDNGRRGVDWRELKKTIRKAVRFMDNVIEVNPYPLDSIRRMSLGVRRIGLGIGGWADMLIELGIPYDSEEALELARKVMKTISEEASSESQKLARERGPFPLFEYSIYKNGKPRRHSTVTTIAPTGSISIIADASGGIEPIFAIAYRHVVKDKHLDRTLTFINPRFEEVSRARGFWNEEIRKVVLEHGTVRGISEIPKDVRDIFGTAHEIHHDWHIRMQAAFQEFTENAVSKTINLRNEVNVEDIKEVYKFSWKSGCRGITVFRDGCKDMQVLNLGIKDGSEKEILEDGERMVERSYKVAGSTYKLDTPVGTAFVTINEDGDGEPIEVFINVGKAGSDVTAVAEALGRMISTSLRLKGYLSPRERAQEIAHQLSGIGGRRSVGFGPNRIRSLPDAVAVALGNHLGFKLNGSGKHDVDGRVNTHSEGGNGTMGKEATEKMQAQTQFVGGDICPSCGSGTFIYEEGCSKCYACGHSEC